MDVALPVSQLPRWGRVVESSRKSSRRSLSRRVKWKVFALTHNISPSEHDSICEAGILHPNIPETSARKKKLLEKIILYSSWINWPVTKYVKTYQCNKMPKWHWSRESINLLSTTCRISFLMHICKAATHWSHTEIYPVERNMSITSPEWLSFLPFTFKAAPLLCLDSIWVYTSVYTHTHTHVCKVKYPVYCPAHST